MEQTKKQNPWLVHVAKFKSDNPSMSYKEVLQEAKKTYTKGSSIVGGKAPKKTKMMKEKAGSISGGAKKPRKTRKDKGTKKGGKMFGEDGHGVQKVPVEHVTAELVKQV